MSGVTNPKPSLAEIFAKYAVPAESVADFLDRYYKPERLCPSWEEVPGERRQRMIADREADVARDGFCLISHHDSKTGETVSWYPPVSADPCKSEVGLRIFKEGGNPHDNQP